MPSNTGGLTMLGEAASSDVVDASVIPTRRAAKVFSADYAPKTGITGGVSPIQPKPPAPSEGLTTTDKMQLGLAGAGFLIDIANANNAYVATTGQAQLNIIQARNQAADALYRGHQSALDQQLQGYQAGQHSQLSAAAQGQDVSGAGAQKVQGSQEAVGIFNGMKEEINSMREALGYQLEEVVYDYQTDQAAITRDNAYIGAGLNLGAAAGSALLL